MLTKTATKSNRTIKISRREYIRLKKIEKDFRYFLNFTGHVRDIDGSRKEIKRGESASQRKLFSKLGV